MKKILMIGKETYTIPLFFLEEKLINAGYETGLFFIYPEESAYDECRYNRITYYSIKKHSKSKIYDLKEEVKKFYDGIDKSNVDEKYICEIEKKYTHFKGLNEQLISSQTTSRAFHYREKFIYTDSTQNKRFLEMAYKKVEQVLDDFEPDCIIDLDSAELLRTVINEVAFFRQIPYITVEYSRFEKYIVPTFNLGLYTDEYFREGYKKNLKLSKDILSAEYEYINNFRAKNSIMSEMYKGTVTAQYERKSLVRTLCWIIKAIRELLIIFRARGWVKKCILFTQIWGGIKDFISYGLLRYKLFGKNQYFTEPCDGENYIYYPLHLIPESSTFVKAPYFVNELNNIEQISKSLPINTVLYVKEHQSMLGERPLEFYKRAKLLPNVKIVSINYYKDPKPWIEKSDGVITITGTSAYESALLGKASIIFGNVFFDVIEGIYKVDSFKELHSYTKKLGKINNIHSCAAYIKTVKQYGVAVDVKYLISEGYKILSEESKVTKKFDEELEKLFKFYEKAISIASNFSTEK